MFHDGYGDYYVRNRNCHCPRCMAYWLMGPAILITIGVLFLLEQLHVAPFGRTFPILLIVIGLVKIAQRSAPDMGHVQPGPYSPLGHLADEIRNDIHRRVNEDIARRTGVPPSGPTIEGNPSNSEVNRG
ncbi:MAG TPA: DUF5668 domain-containing protein [Terriglobales bacterium]|nr:DUF5668 domain-containing protein [Terriglobales bacterium]